MKSMAEWNAFYEKKTGDTARVPPGFSQWYLPERGWCQYKIDAEGGLFILWAIAGDGHFWRDMARAVAANLGLRAIGTICTRAIRPYIRFWHWQIVRSWEKAGQLRFLCKTADNRKVIITHKHIDDDGTAAYWVTEYLTERMESYGKKRLNKYDSTKLHADRRRGTPAKTGG